MTTTAGIIVFLGFIYLGTGIDRAMKRISSLESRVNGIEGPDETGLVDDEWN